LSPTPLASAVLMKATATATGSGVCGATRLRGNYALARSGGGSGGEAPPDRCGYGFIERGGPGRRRGQAAPSRAEPRRNAVDPVFRRLHRGFEATHQRPGVNRHNPPPQFFWRGLWRFLGLSFEEIGDRLGTTAVAAHLRLQTAIRRMPDAARLLAYAQNKAAYIARVRGRA